jgi:hypothetical protein
VKAPIAQAAPPLDVPSASSPPLLASPGAIAGLAIGVTAAIASTVLVAFVVKRALVSRGRMKGTASPAAARGGDSSC